MCGGVDGIRKSLRKKLSVLWIRVENFTEAVVITRLRKHPNTRGQVSGKPQEACYDI